MFRDAFKYFKSKNPPPDVNQDVLHIERGNCDVEVISPRNVNTHFNLKLPPGLLLPEYWEIFTIKTKPGLIFIKNPFDVPGQRYWIKRCLADFSKKPYKLNIDPHKYINDNEQWWTVINTDINKRKQLHEKLRWSTLGYHHNWDTKIYSENSKGVFPEDLANMCKLVAQVLGYNDFEAQAAIINYYYMNSTLSGHTDHSEPNLKAPLFSFSFGQSAVFLYGGRTLDDPVLPIRLDSGDIIVMSEESRLCYHAVPLIMPSIFRAWDYREDDDDKEWKPFYNFIQTCRLNINVRQVLNPGQNSL